MIIAAGIILIVALIALLIVYNWPSNRVKRAKQLVQGLTDEQKTLLSSAKVQFKHYDPLGANAITVQQRDVERFCKALDVYVLACLNNEGTRLPELILRPNFVESPAMRPFEVRVTCQFNSSEYREKTVQLLREIVLPIVHRNINVYNLGGNRQEMGDENEFHVFIYSVAERSTDVGEPGRLFNITLPRRGYGHALSPSGVGIPLVDEMSGVTFGELCGRSLYILHDAIPNSPERLVVFAKMLEKSAPELDTEAPLEAALSMIPADNLPPVGRRRVTQYGFRAHRKQTAMKLVGAILLPAVREDVCIRDCQGLVQKKADDGAFHVLYNARPANFAADSILPTGRGVPITTDDGGLAGELFENNLYVYSDLLGFGRKIEVMRFAQMLLTARRQVIVGRSFNAPMLVIDQFVDECSRHVKAASQLDASVTEAAYKQADEQFAQTLKAARSAEQEIVRLDAYPEELLGREYDSLLKIKKVQAVEVTKNEIVVHTNMLFCTEATSGITYRIGEFHIHIPLNAHGNLKFLNQTQQIHTHAGAMHAPHVSSGGNACLGSTSDEFPELIRNREFASVVQLAILFLESVNIHDTWGKQITNWPVERRRGVFAS